MNHFLEKDLPSFVYSTWSWVYKKNILLLNLSAIFFFPFIKIRKNLTLDYELELFINTISSWCIVCINITILTDKLYYFYYLHLVNVFTKIKQWNFEPPFKFFFIVSKIFKYIMLNCISQIDKLDQNTEIASIYFFQNIEGKD